MKQSRPTGTMQRRQSNTLVHEFPTNFPVSPSGRFRHFLTSRSRRSSSLTNARSHTIPRADNRLRNQLTCLVLVTRVHVVARRCCPSRRVREVSFALADAHSRLLSALWVGHRAASRCRHLQGSLLLRGVRGIVGCRARNEPVKWRVNRTSTRHATDATPHSHKAPQLRKAESQECRKEQ